MRLSLFVEGGHGKREGGKYHRTTRPVEVAAARGERIGRGLVGYKHVHRLCAARRTRDNGTMYTIYLGHFLTQLHICTCTAAVARAGVEKARLFVLKFFCSGLPIHVCVTSSCSLFRLVLSCCMLEWRVVFPCMLCGQGQAVGERTESQRGAKDSSPAERQEDA